MAQYTCYFRPNIYCNIYQNLAKQFTLHSVEAYLEPFQMYKPGGYLFGKKSLKKSLKVEETIFAKSSILGV